VGGAIAIVFIVTTGVVIVAIDASFLLNFQIEAHRNCEANCKVAATSTILLYFFIVS
jgi:hypothetical protein